MIELILFLGSAIFCLMFAAYNFAYALKHDKFVFVIPAGLLCYATASSITVVLELLKP